MGRALRLEALHATPAAGYPLSWRGHVQSVGWQTWRDTPTTIGTTGQALRLEAFEIVAKDPAAVEVQYHAHVQGLGWQPWVKDGATAGTVGEALRVEAVQIRLVPKDGTPTPTPTTTSTPGPVKPSVRLAFTADVGLDTAAKTTLAKIGSTKPDVTNILGDLASQANAYQTFCTQVTSRITTSIPGKVLIVAGSHEEDGSTDGEIAGYAACLPDRVGVTVTYARDYYYDIGSVRS